MATFESMDRRMPKIEACLKANGLESLDACNEMLLAKGIDCDKIVRGVQPICFDNAVWAYTLGTAIAVKRGLTDAAECAAAIGEGLEAFTIPGSVAEQRQVGLGHGNLGARLLSEDTTCFAFLAGHESFAAAEGAIGIARTANKVRKTPLRVILNGLGKDAAYIISRINGRTLHPDNVAAGPASYGLTDSLGRVHGDAQFAGSSSVPAHVEMMGLIGMGNNPMVGATVACAVAAAQANA